MHCHRNDFGVTVSYSYWQSATDKKIIQSDFLIIGGGIAGFSTAFWLEKKYPQATIAIVERHKVGSGASGRNAGFVTCGSAEHFAKLYKDFGPIKALEIWRFSEVNRELLKDEIIKGNSEKVLFQTTGSCTVAPSDEDFIRYGSLVNTMTKLGIDVDLVDEATIKSAYAVKGFKGGIEYKHDGVVHPMMLLREIQSQLKRTLVVENQEVIGFDENTSIQVVTQDFKFQTNKVVLTLNGYIGLLWPEWESIVRPQRGQIVVTEPLPLRVKGPCYLTKHLCYFRQMISGELLIGGFRNFDLDNENTFFDRVSEKIQSELIDFTKTFFDFTSSIKIKNQWSGTMGFTSDGQMIIGEVPLKKNFYLMAGCSGHGMGLSFHAAKVLVEAIEGGKVAGHLSINRPGII